MCNLYNLNPEARSYFELFDAAADPANTLAVEKDYAAPGKPGYVVRHEAGERVLSTMRWGFPTRKPRKRPAREGELPFLYDWWTNARNMQSNMWKPWLMRTEHRCLVPFTRFAEPKAAADRQNPRDTNWWFSVEDQAMPCFAGLWKLDQDHDRVYAFCTTEPNPLVAPKHPKAMPVILLADDQERWLTAPVEEALSLLAAYPSQLMSVS
ncbi:SOS response-associated peptidase [Sphingomonas pseudosanguinis]|uniref:Abasic site processing protein n=1 Tax=Sphingomonas pseudosanguinis TaxID=413712 RepID=A0A7W6A9S9_9SPHN|nr:SOS response-associated peptidase family protein [Sphingomonas pseudosanguinis]MBB3879846.1 putative SOS response-associated peptidase YedK [Sphingomonas pseudosanguinis]MBN3536867.1 SOS response-associated peptidase family protein [Sphingomonas pseudosanguinis]